MQLSACDACRCGLYARVSCVYMDGANVYVRFMLMICSASHDRLNARHRARVPRLDIDGEMDDFDYWQEGINYNALKLCRTHKEDVS